MINYINHFLSHSAKGMTRSATREILKLLRRPGMISFAGGLPASGTFPVDDLNQIPGRNCKWGQRTSRFYLGEINNAR